MLFAFICFVAGVFVGWNVPITPRLQAFQDKVKGFFKS